VVVVMVVVLMVLVEMVLVMVVMHDGQQVCDGSTATPTSVDPSTRLSARNHLTLLNNALCKAIFHASMNLGRTRDGDGANEVHTGDKHHTVVFLIGPTIIIASRQTGGTLRRQITIYFRARTLRRGRSDEIHGLIIASAPVGFSFMIKRHPL
jgi:hypothetical protein